MKLAFTTSVAAACLFAAAAFAQGQPDFSQVQIKSTPLGNNTYMLEGQGGNMVIAVGGDAVIQVDTEFAPLHDKIKADLEAGDYEWHCTIHASMKGTLTVS